MAHKSDAPNQENISDFVERLKQSFGSESGVNNEENNGFDSVESISEDELKERLIEQFAGAGIGKSAKVNDAYSFDEDFLAEAESIKESAENVLEEEQTEILDKVDIEDTEIAEYLHDIEPEIDDEITFDELEDNSEDDGIELTALELDEPEIDDEITFDELEDNSEDDGIEFTALELDELEEEVDVLQSGEEVEGREQEIKSMHLELEPLEDPIPEAEMQSNLDTPELIEEISQRIPEKAIMRQFAQSSDAINAEIEEPAEEVIDQSISNESSSENVDEIIDDILADVADGEPDGAEIALLMQFGCDDEIINRYNKESAQKSAREAEEKNTDDNAPNSAEIMKKKLLAKREEYKTASISMLIRLAICSALMLLVLMYEGFPAMGVELPGILNRDDYFISYVLIGLQLVVLCVLTSYKQIWDGAKRLLSTTPTAYSVVSILCVLTLLYDFCILFVDGTDVPPTFHLPLVITIVLSIVWEWRTLTTEKNNFECFFEEYLNENGADSKKFTLRRSEGKNSTAEKMYKGGLDSSNNVYFPIEINKTEKFFSAVGNESIKSRVPMLLIIPSLAVSLIIGVFALIVSGKFWVGVGGMNLSLLLTLPVVTTVSVWLPFDIVSQNSKKDGYAFASEGCMEGYSDCDVVIFSDLHLFAKCPASQTNLAFYDGTAKDVLLGCLNAVYKEIGGPMADTFANAENKKLGACRLTRVAKSGVEAIVGSNYSVLVGSESFMSRYGIAFPNVVLNSENDRIYTLCVSINGRASARIAVRYTINEPFEMFVTRLAQVGISCAVETYDPMINTELLSKLRVDPTAPISIIHMSAEDRTLRRDENREKILFEASDDELAVIARRSRFNLAVALYTAKRMSKIRKYCNILSISAFGVGTVLAFIMAGLELVAGFGAFWTLLCWMLLAGGLSAIMFKFLPQKNMFSFEVYKAEKESAKNNERK